MSFYNDAILSKQGPLGKVWLASHLERKLGKQALLSLNIPTAARAILGNQDTQVEVMALRLSGQLLLGVVRIYSRKAKYLMDDCSEALLKIKMAFRSGALQATATGAGPSDAARSHNVDMPEQDMAVARANLNINLQLDDERGGDFDRLYNAEFGMYGAGLDMWNELNQLNTPVAAKTTKRPGTNRSTVSRHEDITLPEFDHFGRYDDGDIDGMDGFGSQEYRATSIGIDDELDLGLELDLDIGLMDDELEGPEPQRGIREFSFGIDDFLDDPLESPTRKITANSSKHGAGTGGQASGAYDIHDRAASEVPSVELGRDAAQERSLSLGLEMNGFDVDDGNNTTSGDGVDASRAQDPSFDMMNTAFGQVAGQRTPRARSPLTPLSDLTALDEIEGDVDPTLTNGDEVDLTPRTAKRVEEVAAKGSAARKRKQKLVDEPAGARKSVKMARQIIDSVTEMSHRPGDLSGSHSQTVTAQLTTREDRIRNGLIVPTRYLRRDDTYSGSMYHPSIMSSSALPNFSAFLERSHGPSIFYAGPPGLSAELKKVLEFRLGGYGIDSATGMVTPPTPPRSPVDDERDGALPAEGFARSQSAVPSVELGRDRQPSLLGGEATNGFTADYGQDYFDLDLRMSPAVSVRADDRSASARTPSRASSQILLDFPTDFDFNDCEQGNRSILGIFESAKKAPVSTPVRQRDGHSQAPASRQSLLSLPETQEQSQTSTAAGNIGGWSRNTVKALRVLHHELEEDAGRALSFKKMASGASRKAASSMIYESLILATRGMIKLEQVDAYGDISIRARPKLFEISKAFGGLSVDNERESTPQTQSRGHAI